MAERLGVEDLSPFTGWRLAARCLLDIHKDRRDGPVLERAKERLLSILTKEEAPAVLVDAAETLGWLGDPRPLRELVPIAGGRYPLAELGEVTIRSFEISRYPVTNQWFAEFIKAGGYTFLENWSEEGGKWLARSAALHPYLWHERRWRCPNAPVVGVCWYEADAFCRWLTRTGNDGYVYRLPDEREWQVVAAGHEQREYPWGEWQEGRCNSNEAKIGRTSSVGIFSFGNTPETGVSDLAGNVWEWTGSDYHAQVFRDDFRFDEEMFVLEEEGDWEAYLKKSNEKHRQLPVLRGGSWGSVRNLARCAYRREHSERR